MPAAAVPFQCSFCTIINVQGRKSRRRSPDDIEADRARERRRRGCTRFFITDDNFARNKDWEPILDRLIELREDEGMKFNFIIQVDTLCHKLPNFIEKCRRAGVPARVHRAGEHQSRQPDRREEAAEQDHRIPQDAAGLEAGRASSPTPATSSDFRTTRRNRSSTTSRSSRRELPVDLLEFFLSHAAAGFGGPPEAVHAPAWRWTPISTSTTSITSPPRIRACRAEDWRGVYRKAWEQLLHARARRVGAARAASRDRGESHHLVDLPDLVQGLHRYRGRPSARRRHSCE